jgi:hypothetical protein
VEPATPKSSSASPRPTPSSTSAARSISRGQRPEAKGIPCPGDPGATRRDCHFVALVPDS